MGRARNYRRYKNILKNGIVESKVRWVKIKNKSIKELIKRSKSKVHDYYNDSELPISNICKIIGVWRGKYPAKRFYPVFNEESFIKKCLRRASEVFNKWDDTTCVKVLPGIWQFNNQNLVEMSTPNKSEYTYKQFMDVLRFRKDIDLVLPEIPKYDPESIEQVRVNRNSFSGLNTSVLVGRNRSRSTPYTKPIAKQYAKNIIMQPRNRYVVDTSLYHVGGREKRVSCAYGQEKEVKTRITLSPEDVPTIIGQSVVVLINESLQKLSEGFNWGGRINGRGQFLDLVERMDVTNDEECINVNTDFSGHDNHVNKKEIVFGMALLRCCFPEGDDIDRIFYYITSSLVCKRIVSPESNIVYELWKGLPSGHTFTSILTTITAYLKIGVAVNEVYGYNTQKINKTYFQGAGDDWILKLLRHDVSAVSNHINEYSGGKCDDFSINADNLVRDVEELRPTFLKKAYKNGLIAWNRFELFVNYAYPTSTKFKLDQFMQNVMVHCVSGPFDFALNTISKNLMIVKHMEFLLFNSNYNVKLNGSLIEHNRIEIMDGIIDLAGINFLTPINLNHKFFRNIQLLGANGVMLQEVDSRELLSYYMKEFDTKINKSMRWMLARRIYHKFETIVRLKVFDTKKTYFKSKKLHFINFRFADVYLSYKVVRC